MQRQRGGQSADTGADHRDRHVHILRRSHHDHCSASSRFGMRTAKRFLEHTVTCPRDNPVDDCPHLRGEVEEHLATQRARIGRRKPAGRGSE